MLASKTKQKTTVAGNSMDTECYKGEGRRKTKKTVIHLNCFIVASKFPFFLSKSMIHLIQNSINNPDFLQIPYIKVVPSLKNNYIIWNEKIYRLYPFKNLKSTLKPYK